MVVQTNAQDFPSAGNTHDVSIPANWDGTNGNDAVASGDSLLIIYESSEHPSYDNPPTAPNGWSVLGSTFANNAVLWWFTRTADGTEPGTNVTVTHIDGGNADEAAAAHLYHIKGALSFEIGTAVTANPGTSINVPSITPSWGAKAGTIFIVASTTKDFNDTGVSYPTDYTTNTLIATHAGTAELNGSLASAWRTAETTTEDPDSFTWSNQSQLKANIVAVEIEEDANLISGTIEYPAGIPLQNAIVKIFTEGSLEDQTAPTFVETVLTDANGDWAMQAAYDETLSYKVEYKKFIAEVTGTADSATSSSLTDAGAFVAGAYDDGQAIIKLTGGTGSGQERRITGNANTDTIDIDGSWGTTPDATTTYEVGYMYSDELKFKPPKA